MAKSRAELALAITGIAGPGGGTPEKPVGLVYIAVAADETTVSRHHFGGHRDAVLAAGRLVREGRAEAVKLEGGAVVAGRCRDAVALDEHEPGLVVLVVGDVTGEDVEAAVASRIVSALDIMLEGPIGAAAFNNEFGRPNLCGYFRTFEERVPADGGDRLRGYHKPIMLAGGLGNIMAEHVEKHNIPPGAQLIVLGGPAMLIGLGGGAASSMASGSSHEDLDFASVQRGNPEMQRRCQEIIDRKLDIAWGTGTVKPLKLTQETLQIFKDAGCGYLSLSVESASETMLKKMQRGCTVDHIKESLTNLSRTDIPFSVSLLFGAPGETPETIAETLEVIDAFDIPNGVWVTIGICLWTSHQQVLHDAQVDGQLEEGASLFEVNNYVSPTLSKGCMEELVKTLQEKENYAVQVNQLYADQPG